jgi:acetyl-CoA acetyltransferase
MTEFTIKDRVVICGIGETDYYKQGKAPVPEFVLACQAIQNAARDAGIHVRQIDGFVSYANDRNEPGRLCSALGIDELRYAGLAWGGGGLVCGAVGTAAAAVLAGYANYVVVHRALAQGQFGRFGRARQEEAVRGSRAFTVPYGLFTPAQMIALRTRRFMDQHRVSQNALAAIALTAYEHAQRNPRAVMYGRPLTREQYDQSRWIVEPFHLFDCCQENDGAAAVIVTTADRARDLRQKPAYLMSAAQGSGDRYTMVTQNAPEYASSNFRGVGRQLFQQAGIGPADVDTAQVYENFTGAVMMTLTDLGFCDPDAAEAFCTVENLRWSGGKLPLNTSGGNLAECYMHGLELVNEAVRQLRGESTCQVESARIALVAGGPATSPVSALLLHG